jgi:hypothetical protein
MPRTHRIGRHAYWHLLRLSRDAPATHVSSTWEIDEPFRAGLSLIRRIPLSRKAIAIGIWCPDSGDEDNIITAIDAKEIPLTGLSILAVEREQLGIADDA